MKTIDDMTYVSLEQAKSLKEFGCCVKCSHYYDSEELTCHKEYVNGDGGYEFTISAEDLTASINAIIGLDEELDNCFDAPTLEQVQRWLREEKNMIVEVHVTEDIGKQFVGYVPIVYDHGDKIIVDAPVHFRYEEALSLGITECLTIMEREEHIRENGGEPTYKAVRDVCPDEECYVLTPDNQLTTCRIKRIVFDGHKQLYNIVFDTLVECVVKSEDTFASYGITDSLVFFNKRSLESMLKKRLAYTQNLINSLH